MKTECLSIVRILKGKFKNKYLKSLAGKLQNDLEIYKAAI